MLNELSLFSGIGAFEKALSNLNIPYNLLAYCEIDKYASKSYSAIHGVSEDLNLQDVTKVDSLDILDDVDLITYGFPCQDISSAGKQKGFTDENGNRTRSGLFFEALRIIEEFQPKFAIAENVKALTFKKFTEEFKTVLESLEEAGYNNYWQVLNAKDYGIPQNRERVFIISIRKDIDKGFTFPTPIPLELRLKDLLEDEVDEKYYLSEKMLEKLTYNENVKDSDIVKVANLNKGGQKGDVISSDGICTSLTATDYKQPKQIVEPIKIREATKSGYSEAYPGDSVNCNYLNSKTRRGRVGKDGIANTLTCQDEQAVILAEDMSKDEIDDFLDS